MFSFIVLCVAGYFTAMYFRKNPSKLAALKAWLWNATGHKLGSDDPTDSATNYNENFVDTSATAQARPEPARKTLTELYGPFPCDGGACNPHETCSELERLFCRDVLSKVVAKDHFKGQYTVKVDSGYRHIDFAVDGFGKSPVAIEIDGYEYHVTNLDRKQFNKQLKRQNELSMAGWRIIRFSYDQVVGNPAECRNIIEDMLAGHTIRNISTNPEVLDVYTDIVCNENTHEEREELKRRGAIFSEVRKTWYMPIACHEDVAKAFPSWKLKRWKKCVLSNCEGAAYHRTGPYGNFWACQVCGKTFKAD